MDQIQVTTRNLTMGLLHLYSVTHSQKEASALELCSPRFVLRQRHTLAEMRLTKERTLPGPGWYNMTSFTRKGFHGRFVSQARGSRPQSAPPTPPNTTEHQHCLRLLRHRSDGTRLGSTSTRS